MSDRGTRRSRLAIVGLGLLVAGCVAVQPGGSAPATSQSAQPSMSMPRSVEPTLPPTADTSPRRPHASADSTSSPRATQGPPATQSPAPATPVPTSTSAGHGRPGASRLPAIFNPEGDATYAELSESGAFGPTAVRITSSSAIDLSTVDLGGLECTGFTAAVPDVRVTFDRTPLDSVAQMSIRFVPDDGDAVWLIRQSTGPAFRHAYQCPIGGDPTGGLTISLANPVSGYYEVWIGSRTRGTSVAGLLYISAGN